MTRMSIEENWLYKERRKWNMLALWFSNPRCNLRINADNSQKIHGETTLEPCEEPQTFLNPSIIQAHAAKPMKMHFKRMKRYRS